MSTSLQDVLPVTKLTSLSQNHIAAHVSISCDQRPKGKPTRPNDISQK